MAIMSEKWCHEKYGKTAKYFDEIVGYEDYLKTINEKREASEREQRRIELSKLRVQLKQETQKIIRCQINGIRYKDKRWIIQQKIDALETNRCPI